MISFILASHLENSPGEGDEREHSPGEGDERGVVFWEEREREGEGKEEVAGKVLR